MSNAIDVDKLYQEFIQEQDIVSTSEEKIIIQMTIVKGAKEQTKLFLEGGLF